MLYEFEPIGTIQSCFKDKFSTPRQSQLSPASQAQIVIDKKWQPELSLSDLDQYSHLWVLFVFHKSKQTQFQSKVSPPRLNGKRIGLFSSRSPHRPNPIGLSLVKLDRIDQNTIHISNIDFIEGTPVLDIKPYLPNTESITEATAGWAHNISELNFEIEFGIDVPEKDKELIEEMLRSDSRPLFHKKNPRDKIYAARLNEYDIKFKYLNENKIIVLGREFFESGESNSH